MKNMCMFAIYFLIISTLIACESEDISDEPIVTPLQEFEEELSIPEPLYIAPFSTDDNDVIYDINFTDYGDAFVFENANPDFSVNGENIEWNISKGVMVGTGSSISSEVDSIKSTLQAANEGSIYFEVERLGLTVNELDIPSSFIQSTGRGESLTTTTDYLLRSSSSSTDFISIFRMPGKAAAGQMRLNVKVGGGGAQNIDFFINSQRDFGMTDDEYHYARIIVTWKSNIITVIVDGLPVITQTLDQEFSEDTFDRFIIGNQSITSVGNFGDYFIRRFQLSAKQSRLDSKSTRILFGPGDSYMAAFTDGSNIDSYTDINKLFDGTGRVGSKSGLASFLRGFAVNHQFVLTNITGYHGETEEMNGSIENGEGYSSSAAKPLNWHDRLYNFKRS